MRRWVNENHVERLLSQWSFYELETETDEISLIPEEKMKLSVNYSPFRKATSFSESEQNQQLYKPTPHVANTNRGSINKPCNFFDKEEFSKPPLPTQVGWSW